VRNGLPNERVGVRHSAVMLGWVLWISMVNELNATVLGTMALKTGGKDLSYSMLSLYLIGVSLWLGYGLLIGAVALTWANAVSPVFVGACIALKAIKERGNRLTSRATPKKMRIAIDMDETIANSLKEHICRFNSEFGMDLRPEDLRGKN
jgi:hypothetical protein